MKTENRIKFTTLLEDIEVETYPLAPIVGTEEKKAQKQGGCIRTETKIQLFCPKCKSDKFRKSGTIKGSNRQRYRCKECDKSFSLSGKVVDVELLFELYYDEQHKDQKYMLNTRYRKERSSKTDSRYMTFFDGRLKELDLEGRHTLDEAIRKAFKDTNVYIDNLEQSLLSKQHDSFDFFLNYKHSDISYHTKHEHYMLVRKHDIDTYAGQNPLFPLFFCECGSIDLKRHGANNNGRSRLKCQICKNIFLINLQSVIHKSYFEMTFRELFCRVIPNFPLLDELMTQMYHDFYHTKFYTYFENLVAKLDFITHRTKFYVVQLFFHMQLYRYVTPPRYTRKIISKSDMKIMMDSAAKSGDMHSLVPIHDILTLEKDERDFTIQIKDFSEVRDLEFLKTDGANIDDILSSSQIFEASVPKLFDNELLLELAFHDSLYVSEMSTKLENNITDQTGGLSTARSQD